MVKHLSSKMDKGIYDFSPEEIGEPHNIASLCKKFFKELPDSLIPASVHDAFVACARIEDKNDQLARLKELVYHLPVAHYHTLKFLVHHLRRVVLQCDVNKVCDDYLSCIATCTCTCVFRLLSCTSCNVHVP